MYFYYVTIGLQAICVLHCIKKGNQNKWIWIIVFLPVIGCLIYLFSEIITDRQISQVSSGVVSVLNPSGSVRKLEEQLRFADTFQNRVDLADAYLANGRTKDAIDLYEQSFIGVFTENEHLLKQLIIAYSIEKRYEDIIPLAQKIYRTPQFARSRAHLLYAIALEHTGKGPMAEKEFKLMNARFSNYESRYQYGLFLIRAERNEEAKQVFNEMLSEASHLTSRERRGNQAWFNQAREELKKMSV
jgi:hypothetical protein